MTQFTIIIKQTSIIIVHILSYYLYILFVTCYCIPSWSLAADEAVRITELLVEALEALV